MKRTFPAKSGSAKRSRKKTTGFQQYIPNEPLEPDSQEEVQVIVGTRSRRGRFGVRRSTVTVGAHIEPVNPTSDLAQVPVEDSGAPDAEQWHDMLGDNITHVVKAKRKQRNDSVSFFIHF